ncbi:hypothetical protein RIR_jg28072.t1 [Rhizophagus irregularis DAOM 181602=DAOM 197198]|uniref:Uncharacterized protein n=1 Tax=Rhizophagus irregularis (strain DAOM 181602 / DAOM 197198 / MUCL 43194) TaxID=747089 RepID=U9T101_RHIID|nr:hypothetical protein RIR_jg28072.t1 [Rhizophagus irregularis DAOM 181602=DAOM 197198]
MHQLLSEFYSYQSQPLPYDNVNHYCYVNHNCNSNYNYCYKNCYQMMEVDRSPTQLYSLFPQNEQTEFFFIILINSYSTYSS